MKRTLFILAATAIILAVLFALPVAIARLKAQRSQAEALHAERIRRTLTEAARWN